MISEADALQRVVSVSESSDRCELLPLTEAVNRIAARDVVCTVPMPRFRSTSVDGYALTGGAHAKDSQFRLAGEQPAGLDRGLAVGGGEAIRVFTGAPLPRETTTIIMQEDVLVNNGRVVLQDSAAPGPFIREPGEDLCEGQRLLSIGDRLTPQRLSLLASQGLTEIKVVQGPRVAVFSTGNELVPPGQPLRDGQLYESNGLMLRLLATEAGASKVDVAHVPDDPVIMREAVRGTAEQSDMMLLSGGVSVGDHDHVRPVLNELGLTTHFWKVRVKPGKPLLFGQLGKCLVFGLPGNPASSFVSFQVFCLPAFRRWFGASPRGALPQMHRATLSGHVLSNDSDRPHYVRGLLDWPTHQFQAIGLQQSHAVLSLGLANAVARVPEHATVAAGEPIEAIPFTAVC